MNKHYRNYTNKQDNINANIAEKYLKDASNYIELDDLQKAKIKYSICIILGELEKIFFLSIVFILTEKIKPFILICITLALTKHYLNGFHVKTVEECLIISYTVICSVMSLYGLISINKTWEHVICIIGIIIMLLFAPMKSENHYIFTKAERYRSKAISVVAILVFELFFHQMAWKEYILLTLAMVEIEAVCTVLYKNIRRV